MNLTTAVLAFVISTLGGALTTLIGYLLGWRHASQRQVDALLRAETRLRHPTAPASSSEPAAASVARARAAHARSVFMPERVADGPKLGLSTAEATSGVEALSEAVRQAQRRAAVDRPICGRDVAETGQQPTPCLRAPGHGGEC
jgi:hypothetical protein